MTGREAGPALPGAECSVPPHTGWSDVETWIWQEVGSGRIANVNHKLGRAADPKKPEEWRAERRLRPTFLETILLHDPWRTAIPRQGVRLEGVWFDERIELSHALIPCLLWFRRSRLDGEFRAVGSDFSASLVIHEAVVSGNVCMDAANFDGHVLLRSSTFKELDLKNSNIRGQLSLQLSTVEQLLILHGAHVGGSVIMRAYETTENLFPGMGEAAFKHLDFVGSRVDRDLNLQGACVSGEVRMERLTIGGDLFLRDTTFKNELELSYSIVQGSIDLRGAQLSGVDLTGSSIGRELRLAMSNRSAVWSDTAHLDLYDAHVIAIVDEPGPTVWPSEVGLDGFTYVRFGGGRLAGRQIVAQRSSTWFIEWLGRSAPYSPQPYQQCAKVLRDVGYPEKANDVLYAGRERERSEVWKKAGSLREYGSAFGLCLLKWTIGYGYGYRYFRSLWWIAFLTSIGALWLGVTDEYLKVPEVIAWSAASWPSVFYNVLDLLAYSLDLLLPIISLDDRFENVNIDAPIRYWFYFEKIMGYVLASFLIAGLAGLTK